MIKYMGGKVRLSKRIVAYLESIRKPGQPYVEPFVGGVSVIEKMTGVRVGLDISEGLINFYKGVQKGWVPPDNISEEEYRRIETDGNTDNPIYAFAGLACSFGGQFWQGYASDRGNRNYSATGKKRILRDRHLINGVTFSRMNYRTLNPDGCLIYCDPPYLGTKGYNGLGEFDSREFWDVMRKWRETNTVVISEYNAPDDFECVAEFDHFLSVRSKNGCEKRTERLFR